MGIGIGAAFLSKYAVLFILPGGVAALTLLPAVRISLRDFVVAVVAAALVAAPNLLWNLNHDITTVRHTQDIAHWSTLRVDLKGGLEFVATQFAVTGPILFAALIWAGLRVLRGRAESREALLVWLSLPIVVLITLQAVFAKAYGNWAATAYIAGTIAAVWLLKRLWPRGLLLSLAINGVVCAVFPFAYIFPQALVAPNGDAAMMRNLGRAEVSRAVADLAEATDQAVIVADNRDILADLFYTLRDAKFALYARPPAAFPKNYYEQTLALPPGLTGPVLFVTLAPFGCTAEPSRALASWTPARGNYRSWTIYVYQTVPACLAPSG
jgi:4-amino-4-deoxy-L-arabinose transferase-like glycosyltransferase